MSSMSTCPFQTSSGCPEKETLNIPHEKRSSTYQHHHRPQALTIPIQYAGSPTVDDNFERIRGKRNAEQRPLVGSIQDALLEAITGAQLALLTGENVGSIFDNMLMSLLTMTQSEYGFIGEVLIDSNSGDPYLRTWAITDISWNGDTAAFYDSAYKEGMKFTNLSTLFGRVMTGGKAVISDNPYEDERRGGLPAGHPPLNDFCGIPFFFQSRMVGMVGIANRPGGYNSVLLDELEPFLITCACVAQAAQVRLKKMQDTQQKELFFANLAHEIKTPLQGIIGMAEIMSGAATSAASVHELGIILQSGNQLLEVVDNMLDYTKLDDLSSDSAEGEFNLNSLIETCIATVTAPALSNNIFLSHLWLESHPVMPTNSVKCQGRLVERALLNLLSNAVKFTDRGSVTVTAEIREGLPALDTPMPRSGTSPRSSTISTSSGPSENGDMPRRQRNKTSRNVPVRCHTHTCTITVTDTGRGVSMNAWNSIFEPFKQGDTRNNRGFGGTGLGLAACKRVADHIGGKIEVLSTIGVGSQFSLVFPITPVLCVATPATTPTQTADGRHTVEHDSNTSSSLIASPFVHEETKEDPTAMLLLVTEHIELKRQVRWMATSLDVNAISTSSMPEAIAILQSASVGTYSMVLVDPCQDKSPAILCQLAERVPVVLLAHPTDPLWIRHRGHSQLDVLSFLPMPLRLEMFRAQCEYCVMSSRDEYPALCRQENWARIVQHRIDDMVVTMTNSTSSPLVGKADVDRRARLRLHHSRLYRENSADVDFKSPPTSPGSVGVASSLTNSNSMDNADIEDVAIEDALVLAVDDISVTRVVMKRQLTLAGFSAKNVHFACNGKEAAAACAKHNYAVILMDLQMPIMDGIESTRLIRKVEPDFKFTDNTVVPVHPYIIGTSATCNDKVSLQCLAAGMNVMIPKPIRLAKLKHHIKKIYDISDTK